MPKRPAERPRPVNISDVAAAAGVSRATVSRVANGLGTVDPVLAERVRQAMAELAYSPSGTAQSLSRGATRTIAMMVPDLGNPMFQKLLQGLTNAAAVDGYRVIVADSQERLDEEMPLAREVRRMSDAIVLAAPRMDGLELLGLLGQVPPALVINRSSQGGAVPSVTIDYTAGIRALMEHLLGLGHRRIAYLQGPERSASNVFRMERIAEFVADLPAVEMSWIPCGTTMEHGYDSWPAVRESRATAVLAFDDVVALGLLGRLNEEGVSVPEALSVVGFDDIQFSRFSDPPLTTVAIDHVQMGETAWRELRAEMTGRAEHTEIFFTPELRVRRSTGPVPTPGLPPH
jgi:LacI family transcriptional regulator